MLCLHKTYFGLFYLDYILDLYIAHQKRHILASDTTFTADDYIRPHASAGWEPFNGIWVMEYVLVLLTILFMVWLTTGLKKIQREGKDHTERLLRERDDMIQGLELMKKDLERRTRELDMREVITVREKQKLQEEKEQVTYLFFESR